MPNSTAPVWFITGCSAGFGRELARAALQAGYRVVATARDIEKMGDLIALGGERLLRLTLDVTVEAQIASAVAAAQSHFGHIDVFVNNAGHGYYVAIEEGEQDKIRNLFETNVFSFTSLLRHILPGMRRRRNGFVVVVGSVGGLVGMRGVGYYSATKFALEGLCDSLRAEAGPLGIRVMMVEPGPFQTNFANVARTPAKEIDDYIDTIPGRRVREVDYRLNAPGDPVRAAVAIVAAVAAPEPPHHLLLGSYCLEPVREKFTRLLREVDQWEAVTRSADFPDAKSPG